MQKRVSLRLKPHEADSAENIRQSIAQSIGISESELTGYYIVQHSIDARSRQQIWINLSVIAFINEPFVKRPVSQLHFRDVSHSSKTIVIVGAGPAGLFAALRLIKAGIKPVILERGKDVRSRRRDLALLNKEGIVNPESNYCFGEGGAGTYSDGKLYTRSSKRGNINRILNSLVQFGAEEKILYQSHPHIGTNKLPQIITAIRQQILDCGGEFLFEKKVTGFNIKDKRIHSVTTADGDTYQCDAVVLATGHSARDIFELLYRENIKIEAKPFALGVRVEHPQTLIDSIQYHQQVRDICLPPASYSLVEQVNNKGVFSFCMCPGGIIAPAATSNNELVVNGWSPSKRNNQFANSGVVVQVEEKDVLHYFSGLKNSPHQKLSSGHPLLMMYFQQTVEQYAFKAGGGKFVAPAQRMVDFANGRLSSTLPECSYLPGIKSTPLQQVLPSFIHRSLQEGFKAFGKKMKGYYTNDAVIVATESRTSSPVRIPRNTGNLQHPQIDNLYPCGEGAGYAGGIVSAAMDGEKVAEMICEIQK